MCFDPWWTFSNWVRPNRIPFLRQRLWNPPHRDTLPFSQGATAISRMPSCNKPMPALWIPSTAGAQVPALSSAQRCPEYQSSESIRDALANPQSSEFLSSYLCLSLSLSTILSFSSLYSLFFLLIYSFPFLLFLFLPPSPHGTLTLGAATCCQKASHPLHNHHEISRMVTKKPQNKQILVLDPSLSIY